MKEVCEKVENSKAYENGKIDINDKRYNMYYRISKNNNEIIHEKKEVMDFIYKKIMKSIEKRKQKNLDNYD